MPGLFLLRTFLFFFFKKRNICIRQEPFETLSIQTAVVIQCPDVTEAEFKWETRSWGSSAPAGQELGTAPSPSTHRWADTQIPTYTCLAFWEPHFTQLRWNWNPWNRAWYLQTASSATARSWAAFKNNTKTQQKAAMAILTGPVWFQLYTCLCQARNEIWVSKHLFPTRVKVLIKKNQSIFTPIYYEEGLRGILGNFSHNRHIVVIPRYTSKYAQPFLNIFFKKHKDALICLHKDWTKAEPFSLKSTRTLPAWSSETLKCHLLCVIITGIMKCLRNIREWCI